MVEGKQSFRQINEIDWSIDVLCLSLSSCAAPSSSSLAVKPFKDEDKQLEVKKEVVVDVKQYSGVELIIKSGFGSTLPSKYDLIRTYEKFGALDKERSCTFENDSCARVSFLNVSEGEGAFYESLEKCPFATTSTVTFSSSILLLRTERG
ncbi:unnamed protein product [Brassica rapa subsp. trilocularis]